jgi:hypothetical protein
VRGTRATGGGSCAFELSSRREGEGGHHTGHLDALALGAGNLIGRFKNQFLEFVLALPALIFIDRHGMTTFTI